MTVILEPIYIGVRTCTLLLPAVLGVSRDKPVMFETIESIKATGEDSQLSQESSRRILFYPSWGR